MDPLLDNEFLKELFSQRYRETYARIISLNIDEEPLEEIQGRITQGSVNLDGNSSLRRSCSLSFTCNNETAINDYYWTLNTKFKLLLGLKNYINSDYPEVIWFKLGTYIITSFSYSYSATGMGISISGKDKMCLVNGDVSGAIYASVDFGTREEVNSTTGEKELVDINIEDIIREAVHEYAHEPWENIIIRDLPKYGLYLLEWDGDQPLYALIPADATDETANVYINQGEIVYKDGIDPISISEVPVYLTTNELNLVDKEGYTAVSTSLGGPLYFVCKIDPGQSAGYDVTELTYPREKEESGLITSVGDSVTSVLDKIVTFLGNYEYFYNTDGQFIFQKKNKWIDTNWNSNDFDATGMGNDYNLTSFLDTTWMFEGSELITSFSNSPNIGNIKNDFTIWGERGEGDTTVPIHMRYAVDKKPVFYKSVSFTTEELRAFKKLYPNFINMNVYEDWPSVIYYTEEFDENLIYQVTEDEERLLGKKYFIKENGEFVEYDGEFEIGVTYYEYTDLFGSGIESHKEDWRELIYQMALDYRRFNHFDTFNMRILQANTIPNKEGGQDVLYPKGITGYEQYYVDLEGFWRYLYHPDYDDSSTLGKSIKEVEELDLDKNVFIKDHYYNIQNPPVTAGDATYYYVGKIEDRPYMVENPTRVDIKKYLENKYVIWEQKGLTIEGWTGNSPHYFSKTFLIHSAGDDGCDRLTDQVNTGIYYDNGAEEDLRYNKDGQITPGVTTGGVILEKYNLLLPMVTDISLAQLQDNLATRNLTYNSYTVYKVNESDYYMLELVEHYKPYQVFEYDLVKINVPTVSGIQRADTGEQIYRFSYSHLNEGMYLTKVGVIEALPSTYTYDKFYTMTKERGMTSLIHIENPAEILVNGADGAIRWHAFRDSSMFNFTGDSNDINNSSLWLTEEKDYLNTEDIQDFTTTLITGNEEGFVKYYNQIKYNNLGLPVLDNEDNYTFKHSPIAYYQDSYYYDYSEGYTGKWNILKNESPELLIFWFDFLDSQTSEIGKYGANNVMDRSKASNESNVKAIYYRDSLNIVYERMTNVDERYKRLVDYTRSGYNIMQAGDWVWDYFKVANCGKSCKDVLDEWLQAYTQANESVSISCIPIYTLEPNNRISVHDDNIKINGEYIINSISIPLTYNGTMSINATKAVDKLQ